jgi:hypothetical protein
MFIIFVCKIEDHEIMKKSFEFCFLMGTWSEPYGDGDGDEKKVFPIVKWG